MEDHSYFTQLTDKPVSVTKYIVETAGEYIIAGIPSARMGTPEDVAGTALYLASRAGAYVNGATITLDGGTG